jgi:hypothetical protein
MKTLCNCSALPLRFFFLMHCTHRHFPPLGSVTCLLNSSVLSFLLSARRFSLPGTISDLSSRIPASTSLHVLHCHTQLRTRDLLHATMPPSPRLPSLLRTTFQLRPSLSAMRHIPCHSSEFCSPLSTLLPAAFQMPSTAMCVSPRIHALYLPLLPALLSSTALPILQFPLHRRHSRTALS